MKQIVLMYHDVYRHDIGESGFNRERDIPYKLSVEQFEKQVRFVSQHLAENKLANETVIFSFDDGGQSFYTNIAPILEKYGFKGWFFISTKYIGTETFVSKEQIQELSQRGHMIGSHAHTHEHLHTMTPEQVYDEWRRSKCILEDIIGDAVESASIPNGDVSKNGLKIMNQLGFKNIYTSIPTTKVINYNNSLLYGRYVILTDSSVDIIKKIISSRLTRSKKYLTYCGIKIIKEILGSHYIKIKNYFMRIKKYGNAT